MPISELPNVQCNDRIEYSILRESDFYSELKSASEAGQKSTFALILSMLTTDANELDQFQQPQTKPLVNKSDLYKKYFVQQTELRDVLSSERSISFNKLIQLNDRQSIQLDLAIKPEALLPNSETVIAADVFNNLDINTRARFVAENKAESIKNETANISSSETKAKSVVHNKEIDVEAWFNVLEEARTLSMTA